MIKYIKILKEDFLSFWFWFWFVCFFGGGGKMYESEAKVCRGKCFLQEGERCARFWVSSNISPLSTCCFLRVLLTANKTRLFPKGALFSLLLS